MRLRLATLLVAAFAAGVYLNSLDNGFVFDDLKKIGEPRALEPADPRLGRLDLVELFTTNYWGSTSPHDGLYRPLANLGWALDHALHRLRPAGYHLGNVLWHAIASVLVLLLGARLFRRPAPGLAAALLFAAHPIHTEAVANVVGRAELMAFAFSLASLLAFMRAREGGGRLWWAASFMGFALALLSKETAAPLPVLVLLWELVVERRGGGFLRRPAGLLPHAGLLALLGLFFLARRAVLGAFLLPAEAAQEVPLDPLERFFPLAHLPAGARVLTAFSALGRYGLLLLWPVPLAGDYSFDAIPQPRRLVEPAELGGIGTAAGMLLAMLLALRRSARAFWALSVLAGTLLPAANFLFPVGTVLAERLLYFPSLGFCLLAGQGFAALADRARARGRPDLARAAWGACALIAALYAARAVARNPAWKEEGRFWEITARAQPRNSKALFNWGWDLFRRWEATTARFTTAGSRGLSDSAAALFDRALEVNPALMRAHLNLGVIHSARKEFDLSEERYRSAIAVAPGAYEPWANLAVDLDVRAGEASRSGRGGQARELRRRALACQDEALLRLEALIEEGYVHLREGKLHEMRAARDRLAAALR